MIRLILPFPPIELNPNKRLHWSKKAKAASVMRLAGKVVSKKYAGVFSKKDILQLHMMFFPPTRRRLDLDNAMASCKSIIDGVADGLLINDSQIKRITVERADRDVAGRVEAIIEIYGDGNGTL